MRARARARPLIVRKTIQLFRDSDGGDDGCSIRTRCGGTSFRKGPTRSCRPCTRRLSSPLHSPLPLSASCTSHRPLIHSRSIIAKAEIHCVVPWRRANLAGRRSLLHLSRLLYRTFIFPRSQAQTGGRVAPWRHARTGGSRGINYFCN